MTGWKATGTSLGCTMSSMPFGRLAGSRDAMDHEGLMAVCPKGCNRQSAYVDVDRSF